MIGQQDPRAFTRAVNRQLLVREVLHRGSVTKAVLNESTGLSKPTIAAIVSDLLHEGWLEQSGVERGSVGRNSALYSFCGSAGRVIGLDLGGTKLRAALADLSGEILDEIVVPTDTRGGDRVVEQLAGVCRQLVGNDWTLLTSIAIGAPGVLNPATGGMDLAFNIPSFGDINVRRELEAALEVPVVVENDVNMAALGEQWSGHAVGVPDFVFVAIGTGIGMGVVADGRLRRGTRGAAGEVAYLPIGADPLQRENQTKGPLEEAVAGAAIVRRYRDEAEAGDPAVRDVPGVFDAASHGNPTAARVLDAIARDIALGLVAVVAVIDPQLVVLGGGIGANEALAMRVSASLPDVTMQQPPRLVVSALSHRASLVGAIAVALEDSLQRLFAAPNRSDGPLIGEALLPANNGSIQAVTK